MRIAMRKSYVLAACVFAAMAIPAGVSHGILIASWDFETNTPADLNNSVTIGPVLPSAGVGVATGVHASAATDWTTPAGNGSANSLSSNTWAIGDYYQFSVATGGNTDFTITWDQVSSGTGPRDFSLQVSLNGGAYAGLLAYTVLENGVPNPSWNATTSSPAYSYSHTVTGVVATTIAFRMTDISAVSANGGAVGTGGTDRVDNISIVGTVVAVPEASSLLFGGLICSALGLTIGYRKLRARSAA
jgi:hypothetical protein